MEIIDSSITAILLLLVLAIIAGFIDTLVGGGGLITIPALLMAGLPPLVALGTNKLQAVAGTATASYVLFNKGVINWVRIRTFMLLAFCGSMMGTLLVQFINAAALNWLIPFVIIVIAGYFIFTPAIQTKAISERRTRVYQAAVPTIGAYDGMFGPATGSFFLLAGVSLKGKDIITATAEAKTLNFATNFASLITFAFFGNLIWQVGLPMMVGQIIGAKLGSSVLLNINPLLLKWLVVGMALIMLLVWWLGQD